MHAAGAPLGEAWARAAARSTRPEPTPAQALDALALDVWDSIKEGERFDGSVSMGGVVRGDDGWRCWAAFGLADEGAAAIQPFEVMKEPHIERKPGRVTVKAQFLIWTPEMDQFVSKIAELDDRFSFHPGGVIGPASE